MFHSPVLLEESVKFLIQNINGTYIDCTFGRGGHSNLILEKKTKKASLYSYDRDPEAVHCASSIKNNNFKIFHDSFSNISSYHKEQSVDGIIYDLGTCSTHLDNAERGFSFNKDGPLDMRFDNSNGITVSDWINKADKKEIMDVLYTFGDEKHGKLISEAIISHREKYLIDTTSKLAKIIEEIYPDKKTKIHPATKSFQAFRIFINNELDEFKKSLQSAKKIIKTNGIIVTIAFHSLEDNIIKNFFKPSIKSFPKDIPLNNEKESFFDCIAKKVRPSHFEIKNNPRSRSAIMRVFKKL